jgi:N4-gp56 family major capsid protein
MSMQIFELGDSTSTATAGTSFTAYMNQPTLWLKDIVDAAKKRHFFAQFVNQVTAEPGSRDVIVNKRTNYLRTWEASAGEGAAVAYTTMDTLNGVQISPVDYNYGVAVPNRSLRVNKVDMIRAAKEELIYHAGDLVDIAVATAFKGATESTDAVAGAQLIYGGAKAEDKDLVLGDVITTDLISDAIEKLKSDVNWVWNHSAGTEAPGATVATKNPWPNENDYTLFIGPAQENVFRKDSQFVNAAEYGDRTVLKTGEIGDYLGLKVIVTNNIPTAATGAAALDAGGSTVATTINRCILTKPRKAVTLAWGQKPRLAVIDFERELEKDIILEQAYAAGVIHSDAVCHIDVARK